MTKVKILKKISEVDDKLLDFFDKKPKLDPLKLKKVELERLMEAYETFYELFSKCSDIGEQRWDIE